MCAVHLRHRDVEGVEVLQVKQLLNLRLQRIWVNGFNRYYAAGRKLSEQRQKNHAAAEPQVGQQIGCYPANAKTYVINKPRAMSPYSCQWEMAADQMVPQQVRVLRTYAHAAVHSQQLLNHAASETHLTSRHQPHGPPYEGLQI
jgi:hypothetical protein